MKNAVTIRDIPYEFLKDRSDEFFSSDLFLNHEALFLSKKKNTPLLEVKESFSNIPSEMVENLKKLIKKRYKDFSNIIEGEDELLTYYYAQALSIANSKDREDLVVTHPKKDSFEISRSTAEKYKRKFVSPISASLLSNSSLN